MTTQAAASTEYLRYPVSAVVGGSPLNPTSDPVAFAFPPANTAPVTWINGSWETVAGVYYARILVGPGAGGTALAAGTYDVWWKVTDNPEIPVRKVDGLVIV